jgi:hypothetical protein
MIRLQAAGGDGQAADAGHRQEKAKIVPVERTHGSVPSEIILAFSHKLASSSPIVVRF